MEVTFHGGCPNSRKTVHLKGNIKGQAVRLPLDALYVASHLFPAFYLPRTLHDCILPFL